MSEPRAYDFGKPGEMARWTREVAAYLGVSLTDGTDHVGRAFAYEARFAFGARLEALEMFAACAEIRIYRQALAEILGEIKARAWLKDGRGPYEWNDDDYRREAGWAMDAVRTIAEKALATPAPKGDA